MAHELLTEEGAKAIALQQMSEGEIVSVEYSDDEPGCPAMLVHIVQRGMDYVCVVWVETRADGTEYLYGEL